jgi:hypothetical protein
MTATSPTAAESQARRPRGPAARGYGGPAYPIAGRMAARMISARPSEEPSARAALFFSDDTPSR